MLPRWYVNYKYFVIGGWSKSSLRNENETNLLLLIMKILLSVFINCYLALAIILMILITYSSLLGLFDPMAKETPNFATLKSSSGTRTNDSEVNDHVLSEGCDVGSEILLISCGDIELNPGPTFPCPTCNVMFVTQKLLIVHEKRIHDKREMKCDQCEKVLIGNNNLKNHKKVTNQQLANTVEYG